MRLQNCRKLFQNLKYGISRNLSTDLELTAKEKPQSHLTKRMKGWQINSYGELGELDFFDKIKIPSIKSSTEVLVKVHSTGVNPIDVAMISGYGANLLNVLRCNRGGIEFPLTLGREFAGTIVHKGMGISNLKIGDPVWGVVPVQQNGAHAEYVIVPEYCVTKKPKNLTMSEASGMLYAGLTAWSGIFVTGNLGGIYGALTSSGGGKGKRVLVLGAAGGVGSIAVQILKAEKCTVIASCSTDAIPIVSSLGADHVIDYKNQSEINKFVDYGPYDLILDCAGQGTKHAEQFNWTFTNYVTFTTPLLKNIDDSGLGFGMLKNVINIIEPNLRSITTKQAIIKWAYFVPAPQGIAYLKNLVERKELKPVIDSTYNFGKTNEAYKKVSEGHLRGKVIVDIEKS